MLPKQWGPGGKGRQRIKMAGRHHPRPDGPGSGWTPGAGSGQRRPGVLQLRGRKEIQF